MTALEGVIKFQLEFTIGVAPAPDQIEAINRWRRALYRRRLIGQDIERYGGYGYGNISCTLPERANIPQSNDPAHTVQRPFLISGTQTGHLPVLGLEHYAWVTDYSPAQNRVWANGPIEPSSESLTHGAVYASAPRCNAVLHVHSPLLWHCARDLDIPITLASIPYGTPAMASEVERLLSAAKVGNLGIFAMGGHEDGIVAYGPSLDKAGSYLFAMLTKAKRASIP